MLAIGRREGLREGKLQGTLEIARKMLEDKMPIEKVLEYSGLLIERIQKP